MKIEFGAEVIDTNGKVLGTVDHLVRNLKTGELSKFVVCQKAPDKDLFVSPEDVLEATKATVKLKVSLQELGQR